MSSVETWQTGKVTFRHRDRAGERHTDGYLQGQCTDKTIQSQLVGMGIDKILLIPLLLLILLIDMILYQFPYWFLINFMYGKKLGLHRFSTSAQLFCYCWVWSQSGESRKWFCSEKLLFWNQSITIVHCAAAWWASSLSASLLVPVFCQLGQLATARS